MIGPVQNLSDSCAWNVNNPYDSVNCVVQRKDSAGLAEGASMAHAADDQRGRDELLDELTEVSRSIPQSLLTIGDITAMLGIVYRIASRVGSEGKGVEEGRPCLRVVR